MIGQGPTPGDICLVCISRSLQSAERQNLRTLRSLADSQRQTYRIRFQVVRARTNLFKAITIGLGAVVLPFIQIAVGILVDSIWSYNALAE